MNFVPQDTETVGGSTGFAASCRLSPRHFQVDSPDPETSSLFSTTS